MNPRQRLVEQLRKRRKEVQQLLSRVCISGPADGNGHPAGMGEWMGPALKAQVPSMVLLQAGRPLGEQCSPSLAQWAY